MDKDAPNRRGRPPKSVDAMLDRINIRAPRPVMDAIRRSAAKRKDGGDVADTIRRLLVKSLEAEGEL